MTDEEFLAEVEKLNGSPVTQRIFDALENGFAQEWLSTAPDQGPHREHLHRMVEAVRSLRRSFQSIASNPKVLAFNRRLAANQSVR